MNNPNSNVQFANPKLTLFAFQLRNDLSVNSEEPVDNANDIWNKCQELGQNFQPSELNNLLEILEKNNGKIGLPPTKAHPDSQFFELLPQKFILFSKDTQPRITGELYPLQIHDTYAVDITLRYPDTEIPIDHLNKLNPQIYLTSKASKPIQASLGQTFLILAEPVNYVKDFHALAKDCLDGLGIEINTDLETLKLADGEFLGSPIFEYDNFPQKPEQNLHVLIWFNFHSVTQALEAEGKYYYPLINLLCYRSKIVYAYSESRWLSQQAKSLYEVLKETIDELNNLPKDLGKRLNKLKTMLTQLTSEALIYDGYICNLEIHLTTIKTNYKNYQINLESIHNLYNRRNDLQFFQEFIDRTHTELAEQICVDLSYLNPGRKLYAEIIDSIQRLLQVVQTENEQQLQKNIKSVGAGIIVGTGTGSVMVLHHTLVEKDGRLPSPQNSFVSSVDFSLVLAGGLGILTWWLTKFYLQKK